jgi:hypothetical protein
MRPQLCGKKRGGGLADIRPPLRAASLANCPWHVNCPAPQCQTGRLTSGPACARRATHFRASMGRLACRTTPVRSTAARLALPSWKRSRRQGRLLSEGRRRRETGRRRYPAPTPFVRCVGHPGGTVNSNAPSGSAAGLLPVRRQDGEPINVSLVDNSVRDLDKKPEPSISGFLSTR